MNILYLSIINLDDLSKKSIYIDLLKEFKKNGHDIYTISPREKRLNLPTEYETISGIHQLKVATGNITKTSFIKKGINSIKLENIFYKSYMKYFDQVKFDLVLYATPPITFIKLLKYIKETQSCITYLMLKDIFPQNALDLQILSDKGIKNIVYRYFKSKEEELYNISDFIGCMSYRNVKYIAEHNKIDEDKLEVLPNAFDISEKRKYKFKDEKILEKYHIPKDKIIFMYGGNLGIPQGLDFFLDVLNADDNPKRFYLIVGYGTEYNKIEKFIIKNKLKNVKLIRQLPSQEYEMLLSTSDVGIILLDSRFTIPNFPSRALSYLEYGLPILAATDINSDVIDIINDDKVGCWSISGNVEEFLENADKLMVKKNREYYGQNSRKCIENKFTVDIPYNTIMNHFK